MARPAADEEDDKPLDPAVEKVRRKLIRFVAINLGILLFALMVVLAAVVYKSRPPAVASAPGQPLAEAAIRLPAGARVLSHALSGAIISLHVELSGGGQAIFLYDTAEGRIVGRHALTAE